MEQQPKSIGDRRGAERFPIRTPVTVLNEGRNVSAFTRDISARGIFFYVPAADGERIDQELEFVVEFPPEITRYESIKVRCTGKVVRTHNSTQTEVGVAAQIFRYAFLTAAD